MDKALRIGFSVLLVAALGACQQHAPTSASPGFNAVARQGPESWAINGVPSGIDATYYLALPEGLQFTIEVPVIESPRSNESAALEQAWPYIRYAYEHKLYLRTNVKRDGIAIQTTRIGVALVQHLGALDRGNRVAMSIADIEARINGGGA